MTAVLSCTRVVDGKLRRTGRRDCSALPPTSHVKVMEYAVRVGASGHSRWQLQPLYDATGNGAIAWIRAGYLKELRSQGRILPRRRDIQPEHFLSLEEVKQQSLYYVSHNWLNSGHPDPQGFRLARLVDILVHDENADDDDGVLWDYASIYREPYEDGREKELQHEGYDVWNRSVTSNFRVACVVLSDAPEGHTSNSFWERGMCYAEFLTSTLCQRIVNQKDALVAEHMTPEWLTGWRTRFLESMTFPSRERVDYCAEYIRTLDSFTSQLPPAKSDAVGFVVTCAVANFRFVRCRFLRQLAKRGGPSPRRQDLPRGSFVDGHVPLGRQLWVVSYPWSAQAHPSPNGQKIRELVWELNKHEAADDDVVFLDHMSLWQGTATLPRVYVTRNEGVTGLPERLSVYSGLVELRDRTVAQLREFKFALFETTRLYAFAGGSLPGGTYLQGCRVLVLPEIDDHRDFPDAGEPCLETNNFCDFPREEWRTLWGFTKSVPYHEGGWTCAEYSVANFCDTIHNRESEKVRAVHSKRVWPRSVEEYASMMDDNGPIVRFTKKGDKNAVRFNFWKYCFEFR